MSYENVGHLEGWPDHDCLFGGIEVGEEFERSLGRAELLGGDVEVAAGGFQAAVTHDHLQNAEVGAGLGMVGRAESQSSEVAAHQVVGDSCGITEIDLIYCRHGGWAD